MKVGEMLEDVEALGELFYRLNIRTSAYVDALRRIREHPDLDETEFENLIVGTSGHLLNPRRKGNGHA